MDEKTRWIFILFILFTLGFFCILGILENSGKEKKAAKILRQKLDQEKKENKADNKRSPNNNTDVNKFLFPPINSQRTTVGASPTSSPEPNYLPGGKLQNTFGEMGKVICPRGFHYKPEGTFGHAACKFNSSGCEKYDKVNGNCQKCGIFYGLATDPFNRTKYCTLGTFWTILMYSGVFLIFALHCFCE
jgi:hypothetical protein